MSNKGLYAIIGGFVFAVFVVPKITGMKLNRKYAKETTASIERLEKPVAKASINECDTFQPNPLSVVSMANRLRCQGSLTANH